MHNSLYLWPAVDMCYEMTDKGTERVSAVEYDRAVKEFLTNGAAKTTIQLSKAVDGKICRIRNLAEEVHERLHMDPCGRVR